MTLDTAKIIIIFIIIIIDVPSQMVGPKPAHDTYNTRLEEALFTSLHFCH